ncbi:MAG: GntR family transcriptional regulator [Holophaga sp.]|jgi:DNA-binding GntR family transcriptional regulator
MPPSEGSENMGEGAYRSIIRMILAYQFKPGDVLLETELAERLGLSRTPVAYALGRLVAEGFLEKRKKMGCIIPVPSADDARKVFYARQIIEGQTAAAAARLARPEEMEDLERALDVQDQAQAAHSKEQFSDSNEAFHLGIARMARNPYFERYCRHAFWRSNAYIFFFDTFYQDLPRSNSISRTQVYHQKIFEAIARHDPQEAGKLMEQHVVVTYESLLTRLR